MQTKPLQPKTSVHCPQVLLHKQTGEIKTDLSEIMETVKKLIEQDLILAFFKSTNIFFDFIFFKFRRRKVNPFYSVFR